MKIPSGKVSFVSFVNCQLGAEASRVALAPGALRGCFVNSQGQTMGEIPKPREDVLVAGWSASQQGIADGADVPPDSLGEL